ncbi:MAG: carboxypeptidase regulatory-like domain-containing protein [Methanobrevibacter sp.]|nr:carboxypeptidase regulatory-like domain-containing protein [Methanobrevibacter sp.]
MDNKNKIIIVALIVIIIVLLGAIFAMMPNMFKQDTKLKFKGNSTLNQGDYLKIKLTDDNGTAIANQTINVTITDENEGSDYHSVITNDNGNAAIQFEKGPGKYKVTVTYGGNDKYKGCSASKTITVEEEVVEAEVDSSSQSQTSSGNRYSVDNLPPSNDPYAETSREQIDENYVMQKYEDGYISYVDLRTGERSSGGYYK